MWKKVNNVWVSELTLHTEKVDIKLGSFRIERFFDTYLVIFTREGSSLYHKLGCCSSVKEAKLQVEEILSSNTINTGD